MVTYLSYRSSEKAGGGGRMQQKYVTLPVVIECTVQHCHIYISWNHSLSTKLSGMPPNPRITVHDVLPRSLLDFSH